MRKLNLRMDANEPPDDKRRSLYPASRILENPLKYIRETIGPIVQQTYDCLWGKEGEDIVKRARSKEELAVPIAAINEQQGVLRDLLSNRISNCPLLEQHTTDYRRLCRASRLLGQNRDLLEKRAGEARFYKS